MPPRDGERAPPLEAETALDLWLRRVGSTDAAAETEDIPPRLPLEEEEGVRLLELRRPLPPAALSPPLLSTTPIAPAAEVAPPKTYAAPAS